MQCLRCQHDNRLGAKFCEECAAPLARVCANCGAPLSPTGKFCSECAHPAGQAAPSPSPRFGAPEDLRGSMELLADRDPEDARRRRRRCGRWRDATAPRPAP